MSKHDDDLRDAWLDAALEERLGGAAAPDSMPRTERPGHAPATRSGPRRLAAAAVVLLGLAVLVGVRALRDEDDGATPAAGPPQDPAAPTPIRVLYVDGLPRWEYRYLKNVLVRGEGIRAQIFLFDARPDSVQEHSEGLPALAALPRTTAELAAYDLVLLGDFAPAAVGRTEAEQIAWVREIDAFARGGGGLAFLCGDRAMPQAWRDTQLVDLLPTELEAEPLSVELLGPGIAPQLTAAGIDHPILQLADSPVETGQVLCDVRFHTFFTLGPVREGGTLLALGPQAHPLIAVGRAAKGRTFVIATDESWRLRNPHGGRYYDRLWTRVVRWLAGREL